ncbi:MAG TPA: hypothetical protein VIV11_34965 [Kofleriaceae bacterium]
MRRYLLLIVLVGPFVGACTSDDPAPTVSVLSASPDELYPNDDLKDDVRIVVEYSDADGDLGEGFAEVHDCRGDELLTVLQIPAIAPQDVVADGTRITGSLELNVTDIGAVAASTLPAVCDELGIAAQAANETVFCVVLVDAKDHTGPGDCTTPITLAP